MTMDTKETGRRIMNELMGAGYVEGKDKKRNAFNSVLFDYSPTATVSPNLVVEPDCALAAPW